MSRRIAVVLFNLGGPDRLESIRPFLFNLFNDPAIITLRQPLRWLVATLISTLRVKTAREIYAHMGGASPLLAETEAQRKMLEAALKSRLPNDEVKVVTAMRYWRPFTVEAARSVEAFAPAEVVLLPLYPQYSTTTTGSSFQAWKAAYRGAGRIHSVCCYPERDGFITAYAGKIETILAGRPVKDFRVIFSAHGLPEKIVLTGDPYPQQIERSAAAVAAAVGATDWTVSYQSRVGPMKWIGPTTIETLEQAGREGRGVLVVPIAFVSEHSETLVELDRDYRDLALHAGVPDYLRAPAIGVSDVYIEALADMALEAVDVEALAPRSPPCRTAFSKCPFQQQAQPV